MPKFEYTSEFECSIEELFSYHERKAVVNRLIPPWDDVVVVKEPQNLIDSDAEFLVTLAPLVCFRWIAKHCDYVKNNQFKDIQLTGPFRRWEHTHLFGSNEYGKSYLTDRIEFEPLFSSISRIFAENMIREKLIKTFRYRHTVTKNDIDFIKKQSTNKQFVIGIAGSSGVIGRELTSFLRLLGHTVYKIVRKIPKQRDEIFFNLEKEELTNLSEPLDIVINLAGEPISEGLWTDKKLKAIYDSRVVFTSKLIQAIKKLEKPIIHYINASAIGYYGDRKERLSEDGSKGDGFISDLCQKWELAAKNDLFPTTILRIGVVLTPKGGALKQLLKFVNLNLGATLGDGEQYISWITMDDLIYGITHILNNRLEGVFNMVSPSPVTQKEMMDTISNKLRKVRILSLNRKTVELIYGRLGKEVLLANNYVIPDRLNLSNYNFYFPYLESALDHLLGVKDE
ncbi:TIGR01777 family oxidoreductase [Calditerrivibrio nitroreducens]|uniref:NAD-dependent epimerase/dehydratase n=1 Tax=Calditerrivibrio nitroreducens (strain DSM 19672 / NBRC 101217 / Yu37-1) TaxID=768670 RepID=E4TG62_CALNY|nr:TIGR01777 family oxidoreductase [Calditerrivibrio nitroreducens]ADR19649.1 NAD-dependent epimerase/dehydratase [Calditerrivibrio nitroreducens DSM 19672]